MTMSTNAVQDDGCSKAAPDDGCDSSASQGASRFVEGVGSISDHQ